MAKNENNTEDVKTLSARDNTLARLKQKSPDKSFENDDEIFGQINADYEENEKSLQGYKDRESELAGVFTKDPRVARVLKAVKDGKNPAVELVRYYGKDVANVLDDPKMAEEFAQANQEYLDRIAQTTQYDEEYDKNLAESVEMLDGAGYSDDDLNKGIKALETIATDFIMGKITKESLDMVLKAINHDADVEDAMNVGEVKGRNQRITEKLRKKNETDGIPTMKSSTQVSKNKPSLPSMGALDRYSDDYESIWDRGNVKRTKKS